MLVQQTLDKLEGMGLSGMAQAMRQQLEQSQYLELSFEERLGMLVDRESETREDRRLQLRLKAARLRQSVSVEEIDFRAPRGLDRSLVLSLAQASWVEARHNLLVTGPTGCGKSFVACALAHAAIRRGHTALYVRTPRLLSDLHLARGDGRYPRLLAQLARVGLLLLDDFLITPAQGDEARDLLELIDDRNQVRSTLVVSQLPVQSWHQALADPTLADAILDRLVHNAHRIELKGESMRRREPSLDDRLLQNLVRAAMPRRPRTRHLEPAPWIVCPICGFHTWTQAAVGRPRLTCSDECRQEVYRRRRRARQDQHDTGQDAAASPGSPAGAGAPPPAQGCGRCRPVDSPGRSPPPLPSKHRQ